MEILAPAGGREQLIAAVRCGADAVYLGAKGFNARQSAENFTQSSLLEAISYCHARGVRVHVTLNTLVTDGEMPALMETLREVAESGADAVIVQDLAVAERVKACCPALAMHASTQMTIHNAAGVRILEDLGFTRVVLARELTLSEIAAIRAQTRLELEAFVHGALCVCASGACYLSSMLGGRSGNRGRCAQPCRLDFTAGDRHHALSLKDLSALSCLGELHAAGVTSVKIEGRMKRPEYVAAAVTACRQALEGKPYDMQGLQDIFSRSGFTDGYLRGGRDLSMYGMRGEADEEASRRVRGQLAGLYRHERQAVSVDMALTLEDGEPSVLSVTDGTHTVRAQGEAPQSAHTAPLDTERARKSLAKTGDTPFCLRTLSLKTTGDLTLPASAVNALRRDALGRLLALREAPRPLPFQEARATRQPPHLPRAKPGLRLRFERGEQLWKGMDAEQIILPVRAVTPPLLHAHGSRLVAELPALLFPEKEDALLLRLKALGAQGLEHALCHNLGAIRLARKAGLSAHGGYGLNILSTEALAAYAHLGLESATVSFELHARKAEALGGALARGAVGYGHLPLMQLRCCPAQTPAGCAGCCGAPVLTDRRGISFPLVCNERQFVTLLNSVPLDLSGEAFGGMDFWTLHFTKETAAECRRVTESFWSGPPASDRTRGLYYRVLQ